MLSLDWGTFCMLVFLIHLILVFVTFLQHSKSGLSINEQYLTSIAFYYVFSWTRDFAKQRHHILHISGWLNCFYIFWFFWWCLCISVFLRVLTFVFCRGLLFLKCFVICWIIFHLGGMFPAHFFICHFFEFSSCLACCCIFLCFWHFDAQNANMSTQFASILLLFTKAHILICFCNLVM